MSNHPHPHGINQLVASCHGPVLPPSEGLTAEIGHGGAAFPGPINMKATYNPKDQP